MKNMLYKTAMAAAVAMSLTSCMVRVNTQKIKEDIGFGEKIVLTGGGNTTTKDVSIDDFNDLTVNGAIDVNYFSAEEPKAEIVAADEIIDYIEIRQDGDRITVGLSKEVKLHINNVKMAVNLYSPSLEKVAVIGSGDFFADELSEDSIDFLVSGSGDITLGDVRSELVNMVVTGSGDIRANDLDVRRLNLQVVGSGDIKVAGKAGSVDCGIVGSGDITLNGLECADVKSNVKGSGSINR